MFDLLLGETVSIKCGKSSITGILSDYYGIFQLVKVNDILLPVELVEYVEVLPGKADSPENDREDSRIGMRWNLKESAH